MRASAATAAVSVGELVRRANVGTQLGDALVEVARLDQAQATLRQAEAALEAGQRRGDTLSLQYLLACCALIRRRWRHQPGTGDQGRRGPHRDAAGGRYPGRDGGAVRARYPRAILRQTLNKGVRSGCRAKFPTARNAVGSSPSEAPRTRRTAAVSSSASCVSRGA